MKKENKEFLGKLLQSATPSGWEKEGIQVFSDEMSKFAKEEFTDNFWNSAWSIGCSENPKLKIMLSGHIDNNALMVQRITDAGYIHFIRQGGSDRKTFIDAWFKIITSAGEKIPAFISKKAIHLESDEEYKSIIKMEDLVLDVGATSKKEVEDMGIKIGDLVVFDNSHMNLEFGPGKDFIISSGIDDKIAVYIVEEILRRLDSKKLERKGISVIGVATTQEEVGARSAGVAARRIQPNISIDLDVDHATPVDIGGVNKSLEGDIELGKGAIIPFGPDKNRDLVEDLVDIAKSNDIMYQTKATTPGGTNTSRIQMDGADIKTALVSIPNLYMHCINEKANWSDVESCINLICYYILSLT
jgi:putative aminopeptidase FrvX